MPDDLEQRQHLFQICQVLDRLGIYDEQGHLSARVEPGSDTVLINKHSSPGTTGIQDFIECDLNDDEYPDGVPSEMPFHAQIFKHRDDVNAICHHHAPYTTAVASVGLEMRPVHQVGVIQEGPVTVYDDYDFEGGTLITTESEALDLVDALGDDRALMLRGHGPIVVGESATEAMMASIKLEYNSRMQFMQATIGEPWYLSDELIAENMKFAFDEYKMAKPLDHYLSQRG